MDPDVALQEAREAARIVLDGNDAEALDAAVTLAERFQALDGWLMRGGFAPEAWLDKRPAPGKGGLTSSGTDRVQFARDMLDGSPEALAPHLPPEVREQVLRDARRPKSAQIHTGREQVRLALQRMGYPTEGQHTVQLPIATVTALVSLAAQVQQLTTGEV